MMQPSDEDSTIAWLQECARYFESRDAKGEDAAHWANVFNAEKARKIAAELDAARADISKLKAQNSSYFWAQQWTASNKELELIRAELTGLRRVCDEQEAELAMIREAIARHVEHAKNNAVAIGQLQKFLIDDETELARLRSAAPSGDLRAENEGLHKAVQFAHQWIAGLPGTKPASFEDKRSAKAALEDALASPQPDAGARGYGTCEDCGGPLDENEECPGWYEDYHGAAPSPSPEAAPPKVFGFVSGSKGSREMTADEYNILTNSLRKSASAVLPTQEQIERWGLVDEFAAVYQAGIRAAAPPSGDAMDEAKQLWILGEYEGDAVRRIAAALARRDRAAAEKMREAAAQVANNVYERVNPVGRTLTEAHLNTCSCIRDAIRAIPLSPAPKS